MAEQEDEREILDANRWGVLTRDASRFAIWPAGGDRGEPLASFPATDDGADDAWNAFRALAANGRRERVLPILAVVSVVAAIAWVLARAVLSVSIATLYAVRSGTFGPWLTWLQTIDTIAYAVFLASVGAYVVLWLDRRSRRDAG